MLWWTLRQLKAMDPGTRSEAAKELGSRKEPHAIQALITALGDPHEWVRKAAASALGAIGDAQALPALGAASQDANHTVRRAVAQALGQFGGGPTLSPLLTLLQDANEEVFEAAAASLGHLRDPRASGQLFVSLRHKNTRVRRAALEALQALSWQPSTPEERVVFAIAHQRFRDAASEGAVAVPFLLEAHQDRYSKDHVKSALTAIRDPRGVQAMIAALEEKRPEDALTSLVEALARTGDPRAAPALARALGTGSIYFWAEVVCALKPLPWKPSSEDVPDLQRRLPEALLAGSESSGYRVREAAMTACGWLDDARVAEIVLTTYRGRTRSTGPAFYGTVQDILRTVRDPGALPPLLEALEDDNSNLRELAAATLAQVGDSRAIPALVKALDRDGYESESKAIVHALCQTKHPQALDALLAAVCQGRPQLSVPYRYEWCKFIAEALARLAPAVGWHPPTAEDRAALAMALGRFDDAAEEGGAAVPLLVKRLEGDDFGREQGALEAALVKVGSAGHAGALLAAYGGNRSKVDGPLLTAIRHLRSTRAVEPLLAALLDPDEKLRQAAAAALKDIGWQPGPAEQRAARAVAAGRFAEALAEGPEAVRPLAAVVLDDSLSPGAAAAAAELAALGDRRACGPLFAAAQRGQAAAAAALLALGDRRWLARALETLGERPRSDGYDGRPESQAAKTALDQMLSRCMGLIPSPDLERISRLENLHVRYTWNESLGENCLPRVHHGSEEFDLSRARQLAKQELLRRQGAVPEAPVPPAFLPVTCPQCAKPGRVKAAYAGRKVRCSACQAIIPVPTL